jgi:hypothetical protein
VGHRPADEGQRNDKAMPVTKATPSLADAVASNRIGSVLILVNRFSRYAGPSLVAVDTASVLQPLGVTVTVAALGTTEVFSRRFDCIHEVVDLRRDPGPLLLRPFDVVLTQGWSPACFALLECGVRYRYLVLGSFSGMTAGEALFGLEQEADVLLFHSARNRDLQAPSLSGSAAPMLVHGNAIPSCWFEDVLPSPSALRRIAVISNHVPREMRAAVHVLRSGGFHVDIFGAEDVPRLVTPALVDDYDCVVSIGHSAQKAIARQRPYYCYDHFGGPGYITPQNVEEERHICFSGRSDRRLKGSGEIVDELTSGFAEATASTGHLRRAAEQHHRLEAVLAGILTAGRPSEPRTCRTPRNRNLRKIFQHSYANSDATPFVRNIGFDYEAAPVVLYPQATPVHSEHVERATIRDLPPYIFASTEPSLIAIGVQVCFRRGVSAAEIVVDQADQGESPAGEAVIVSSDSRISKHRQVCSVAVTLFVGVRPMSVRLAARLGDAIVPFLVVCFDASPPRTAAPTESGEA